MPPKDNKALMRARLKQKSRALNLKYASDDLRRDRNVVITACLNHKGALVYCLDEKLKEELTGLNRAALERLLATADEDTQKRRKEPEPPTYEEQQQQEEFEALDFEAVLAQEKAAMRVGKEKAAAPQVRKNPCVATQADPPTAAAAAAMNPASPASPIPPLIPPSPACAACGATESTIDGVLLECGGCRGVTEGPRYCSRDCQAADWRTHKKVCKKKHKAPKPVANDKAPGLEAKALQGKELEGKELEGKAPEVVVPNDSATRREVAVTTARLSSMAGSSGLS